jgi:uncharacterized Fe-S cluster-containing radical SAM superfamily protein
VRGFLFAPKVLLQTPFFELHGGDACSIVDARKPQDRRCMNGPARPLHTPATSARFSDPKVTLSGEPRARVALEQLSTLWFNTGTLCNLTCTHCYIESSPRNDRLAYLSAAEVAGYLDEIEREELATLEIGFTGGEPFMNPEIIEMLADVLDRGYRALVLTNAMKPMMKLRAPLLALRERHGNRLVLRVSVDHYAQGPHEEERGAHSWRPTIEGLKWLNANGFALNVAGRTLWGESEEEMRRGFAGLFDRLGLALDAQDPVELVLFPEMDAEASVPEITESCWNILGVEPGAMMCASSRMVIKRKGAPHPTVVACTLLPYDQRFELGQSLEEAQGEVPLNHPHCARFCVLGGGSCSKS